MINNKDSTHFGDYSCSPRKTKANEAEDIASLLREEGYSWKEAQYAEYRR